MNDDAGKSETIAEENAEKNAETIPGVIAGGGFAEVVVAPVPTIDPFKEIRTMPLRLQPLPPPATGSRMNRF